MKRTVLVLDAHSAAGVEAAQSLGRQGVEVHAASPVADALAFRSRYVSQRWSQPDATSLVEWLRTQDASHGYTLIVPATELSLAPLAEVADDDELRRKAVLPSAAALNTALDKSAMCGLARECGLRVPRTVLHTQSGVLGEVPNAPTVLKNVRSIAFAGGEGQRLPARLVTDAAMRADALARMVRHSPVIEQEYIAGSGGLGIELLYRAGRMVWHFAHRRIHEGTDGSGLGSGSLYRQSIETPAELLAQCVQLLNRLQWHGVAMVEFLVDDSGAPWFMEINPRLWGSLALAIDSGVDFPAGLLQIASGEEPRPQPAVRIGYYTRRAPDDIEWIVRNRNWRLSRRIRELVAAARVLLGRESWDHFDRRDLRPTIALWERIARDKVRAVRNKARRWRLWRIALRVHRKNLQRFQRRQDGQLNLLFLCFGNICRSPFAAELARRHLAVASVSSAGLSTRPDRRSPEHVIRAASAFQLNGKEWRSKPVSDAAVESADVVFLMDVANFAAFQSRYPAAMHKVLMLGALNDPPSEISDPYNATSERTIEIFEQIETAVRRIPTLLKTPSSSKTDDAWFAEQDPTLC